MTTPPPTPYQPAVAASATAYAPVSFRRPPLSKRQKRGAAWGGIVGFNLLTLGFSLFILPILAALFWSIFVFVIRSLNGSGRETPFVGTGIDWSFWPLPGILVAVVGLGLMALAIILSRTILTRHGVHRGNGVTWAGAGIAIVAFWMLSWIPSLVAQLIAGTLSASRLGWGESLVASAGVGVLLAIIGNSVIGWLAWWWMAHALRSDTAASAPTPPVATPPAVAQVTATVQE